MWQRGRGGGGDHQFKSKNEQVRIEAVGSLAHPVPPDRLCAAGCVDSSWPLDPRGSSPAPETETYSWFYYSLPYAAAAAVVVVDGAPALLGVLVPMLYQAVMLAMPLQESRWQGKLTKGFPSCNFFPYSSTQRRHNCWNATCHVTWYPSRLEIASCPHCRRHRRHIRVVGFLAGWRILVSFRFWN